MRPKAQVGETRRRVAALLDAGLSIGAIAQQLGVSKPTVCYHARRLGIPARDKFARRYDWAAVQRYYDEGNSVTACQLRFGFARATFVEAARRGDVVTRPQAMPLDELLAAPRSRSHLKRRLVALGLKTNQCEDCGLTEWRDKPLSMALHHVNGDGDDNRLENLRLLCPNCHAQTDNFAGRNRGRRPAA